jgi:RNA polymerase sigma factor (sigma-70 family)
VKIGASVKVFNFVFCNRRAELGMTQKDLALASNCNIVFISQVETLKMPSGNFTYIRDMLNRLAKALEYDFDLLFPQEYLDAIQNNKLPKRRNPVIWCLDVSLERLSDLSTHIYQLDSPEDIAIEKVSEEELKTVVQKAMEDFTERERLIIKMRFGLEDNKECTLEEVGQKLHITRVRVGQLEAKVLKKLRNPRRSNELREYRI